MVLQLVVRRDVCGQTATLHTGTARQYASIVRSLRRQFKRTMAADAVSANTLTKWFVDQHDRWARTTIRLYRRSLEIYILTAVPDAREQAHLLTLLSRTPRPINSRKKQTSAKKARFITASEARILLQAMRRRLENRDTEILALMCSIGTITGLRPCEWTSATVCGTWLLIQNAKATNGRANGTLRKLSLEQLTPLIRSCVARLCHLMAEALLQAGNWKKLLQRLAAKLARLCKKLGLRRLCLYSLRGTASARLKAQGRKPTEIAAILGHASSATAFRHYPSARNGKGWFAKTQIFAHPQSLAAVRDTYRPYQPTSAYNLLTP